MANEIVLVLPVAALPLPYRVVHEADAQLAHPEMHASLDAERIARRDAFRELGATFEVEHASEIPHPEAEAST